ncbi:HAD-IA family hydrolase [Adlercreutzia faecimuris]|uniref:HAD-IA family hydrolase n=1 Tax=Adlercreutzia faecimuris TaxID=2897341 RepID=A0ABS9WDQ4_9ACTN|nr:HAD-IA family hydrolase [Adlercreutzia sp. JBNU-10]MCI2240939.1 HAD-IA family hydrolase [Adlercreutzia sp. JBNU-10]
MSLERAKAHLARFGREGDVMEFDVSSATVDLAAEAVGCEPARIAKTLSFDLGERVALVVCAGDARIANPKFKARFGKKPRMLAADVAEQRIGHAVGGVCPFGVNAECDVFLDESLRRFDVVYPACGTASSAVRITPDDLAQVVPGSEWVDVCKLPEEGAGKEGGAQNISHETFVRDESSAPQPPFDAFVFDLDGTLLDTLPDLTVITNRALELEGYPPRTQDEIHSFVGNGLMALMYQAVPEGTGPEAAERAMERWKALFPTYANDLTVPYPGVRETVTELRRRGCKLGVLSNKFDAGVQQVMEQKLPGLFDVMHGECAEIPRKPDPTGLLRTIRELGSTPARTVYVGDSPGDVRTARAAGTYAVGAAWGYHDEADFDAEHAEPDLMVHAFADLIALAPEAAEGVGGEGAEGAEGARNVSRETPGAGAGDGTRIGADATVPAAPADAVDTPAVAEGGRV